MNAAEKLSVIADEIRDEQIGELRDRLLPKLLVVENTMNEIKDILRVHTKLESMVKGEGAGKVVKIRQATLRFLKDEQLNMSDLRELINAMDIVNEKDEGDQSTIRSVISALCRDRVILKTDERKRNAPYYINPNPPTVKKYTKPRKPPSDPIKWDNELPEILKDGIKTTKHVMGVIAEKYGIDLDKKDERYRLSNNLRFATHHQQKKGAIEKITKDGVLYLTLPGWNQETLKLDSEKIIDEILEENKDDETF